MNDKQIQREVLNDKRKQYQSKILQFMGKSQQPNLISDKQRVDKISNKRQNMAIYRPTQQSTDYNQENASTKREEDVKKGDQEQSKNPSTHRSKTLNRKGTLINSPMPQQQQQPHSYNHKRLLQKIQSRIDQMNKKISHQISSEQNSLMNEYQERLKSKQQELNKLRLVTNEAMINEKTVERKEQLKREKQNLIEGNHYYSEKLEELKKEFGRLLERRDNQRKNLQILMVDQGVPELINSNNQNIINQINNTNQDTINESIQKSQTASPTPIQKPQFSHRHKKKLVYFSSQDYVQKVLRKYNQKSQIISESWLQEMRQCQKDIQAIQQQKKYQSLLPKISQKRQLTKSKSINPEEEYQSYRKIRNKFDRAKSTGVFDSMGLSIDSGIRVIDSVGEQLQNKLDRSFRHKNKNTHSPHSNKNNSHINKNIANMEKNNTDMNKNQKMSSNSTINNDKSATINITNQHQNSLQQTKTLNQIITPSLLPHDRLYTKQYLEQFVVKKTAKQPIPKTSPKKKSQNQRLKDLLEKDQLMRQNLEPELKIQTLFRTAAEDYYKFKQRQKSGAENLESVENNEQDQLQYQQSEKNKNQIKKDSNKNNNYKQAHLLTTPACQKPAQSLLEMKQFDKKIIMDLLLNHYHFKKYLYQLIVSQFQPKIYNHQQPNLQQVVKNFQLNMIYSYNKNTSGI